MRKCDKDGRDCCICKNVCVLTMEAPPPEGPALNVRRSSGCTYCGSHIPCTAANCPLADGYERLPETSVDNILANATHDLDKHLARDKANPKDIAGRAKPQMGLIPAAAMEAIARVMELGAKKYGPYNWRAQPIKNMVYANAALRHLYAYIGGQTIDPESGQSHLAHVASCMAIVLDAEASGTCIEDRAWLPKTEPGK